MTITSTLLLALKAKKSDVEIHKHSAFQLVFTEDNLFQTTLEKENHTAIFGFVIKPQVAHSCQCSQSNLIIFNIEPYSFLGRLISDKLGKSTGAVFSSKEELMQFFGGRGDELSIAVLLNLATGHQVIYPIDERVQRALSFINKHFKSGMISLQDVAKEIFLSPSRLATLFKQEIGSSISKYILWMRLRHAIFLILTDKGKALTTIALESGFYDSSSMNKYMYQMFGISPSRLRQKSDLIQFLDVERI